MVGDAVVAITDGAFSETLQGVVLGKSINVQTSDADRDLSDAADRLAAAIELYRAKTDEELEAEAITVANGDADTEADSDDEADAEVERFKRIDRVEIELVEAALPRAAESDTPSSMTRAALKPMTPATRAKSRPIQPKPRT